MVQRFPASATRPGTGIFRASATSPHLQPNAVKDRSELVS